MSYKWVRRALCLLALTGLEAFGQYLEEAQNGARSPSPKSVVPVLFRGAGHAPLGAFTVATIGDSLGDSLYNAMHARPDLVKRHDVRLIRWSRPIVGLTRTDYFDYTTWLRDCSELGRADLCFVEIGANDMQSIPVSTKQWIAYASAQWRETYRSRTLEMARILAERRCGQVLWVLQPGFEKRVALACHREVINEVQHGAAQVERTRVLEMATGEMDYGADRTHFNRAYLLQLGPALFQLVDTARQIDHARCLACQRNADVSPPDAEMLPLRWWRRDTAAPVGPAAPAGIQCRVAGRERIRGRRWRSAHERRVKAC